MSLADLISAYGYPAVALGTFIEGDTILVLSGIAAQQGYLQLPGVIIAAFCGVFAGDQLYFHLGRRKGHQFIESRPKWQAKSKRVFGLLHRYQWPVMFGFRFMYGIRIVTPIMIGASGISPWRFLICNFLGTAVWAITIGSLGYAFGQAMKVIMKDIQYYQISVMIVLVLAMGIAYLVGQVKKRRQASLEVLTEDTDQVKHEQVILVKTAEESEPGA